jgi:hypothetical protein
VEESGLVGDNCGRTVQCRLCRLLFDGNIIKFILPMCLSESSDLYNFMVMHLKGLGNEPKERKNVHCQISEIWQIRMLSLV